jgi:hypothetical protein
MLQALETIPPHLAHITSLCGIWGEAVLFRHIILMMISHVIELKKRGGEAIIHMFRKNSNL